METLSVAQITSGTLEKIFIRTQGTNRGCNLDWQYCSSTIKLVNPFYNLISGQNPYSQWPRCTPISDSHGHVKLLDMTEKGEEKFPENLQENEETKSDNKSWICFLEEFASPNIWPSSLWTSAIPVSACKCLSEHWLHPLQTWSSCSWIDNRCIACVRQ